MTAIHDFGFGSVFKKKYLNFSSGFGFSGPISLKPLDRLVISRFSVRFNSVFSVSVRLGFYIVTRARFLGNRGNDFGFGSVFEILARFGSSVFRLIVKPLYSTDFSGTPWPILIDYFSSAWFSVYHDFSGTLNRLWWKISIWPFILKNARLCRFWKSIDLKIKVVVIILWKCRENVGSWKHLCVLKLKGDIFTDFGFGSVFEILARFGSVLGSVSSVRFRFFG